MMSDFPPYPQCQSQAFQKSKPLKLESMVLKPALLYATERLND